MLESENLFEDDSAVTRVRKAEECAAGCIVCAQHELPGGTKDEIENLAAKYYRETESEQRLILGDCIEVMKSMDADTFTAVVTDPPAGIAFMGKEWDKDKGGRDEWIAWMTTVAAEVLRVCKPGAHALVWALPRTSHWTATAWEDAGWEVRDRVAFAFGCLSEDTEILTTNGWERYHKNIANSIVLCYDIDKESFEFRRPSKEFVYDNVYPAYRIRSDSTDQLVSRGHRVIVERGGRKVFVEAEALECRETVPVLESLRCLPEAIPSVDEGTSYTKDDLLSRVCRKENIEIENRRVKGQGSKLLDKDNVSSLRKANRDANVLEVQGSLLQPLMPIQGLYRTFASVLQQWKRKIASWYWHGWGQESSLERWGNLFQDSWQLCYGKICEMSERLFSYGTQGWICDGAQVDSGQVSWKTTTACGVRTSYQPRSDRQSSGKLDALQKQPRAQGLRRTRASVKEVEYHGKVWCVQVPTGAFVARRSGQMFITGNSGFPKSAAIDKHIDKKAGAVREVIGKLKQPAASGFQQGKNNWDTACGVETAPATPDAKTWAGYGTALKPAVEDWWILRKPIEKGLSIAENCVKHGTGALAIDNSRVKTADDLSCHGSKVPSNIMGQVKPCDPFQSAGQSIGRFPANLAHDSSDTVLAEFAKAGVSKGGSGTHCNNRDENGNCKGHNNAGRSTSGETFHAKETVGIKDEGTAARFFTSCPAESGDYPPFWYGAKAGRKEKEKGLEGEEKRHGGCLNGNADVVNGRKIGAEPDKPVQDVSNGHPTVKPLSLMRWLCGLVKMPEHNLILDPFAGTFSTLCACKQLGIDAVGIEKEEEYFRIGKLRLRQSHVCA